MSSTAEDSVDDQAAAWFAKLNTSKIDLQTLADFHVWRRDPGHDAAYERVKRVWTEAGGVRDDPTIVDAVRVAKARIAKASQSRRVTLKPLSTPVILVLCAVGAGFAGLALLRGGAGSHYETAVGQERRFTLSDGTTVNLDTGSAVDVRFSRGERLVRLLRGQALFEVAHRPDWPFHVKVDGLDVHDVGTVFNVRRDGRRAAVTVVSGAVQVSARWGQASWTLGPGQQVASQARSGPSTVDVNAFTRWTTGRVEFADVTLADAVREMNRYAVHPIVLEGETVGKLRVSGAFDTADLKGFARALTDLYGVEVKPSADGDLVVRAPPATRT